MWSLYTEMGDRDASLEGEKLHNNSPIFTNLQKIEINVYGILISDVQIWVQSLFFLWNKALIIFVMYFFDQFKKKKPVLIMLLKSKFLLSISFKTILPS